MKAPPSWSGNMLHGQLQEPDQRKRPPLKAKTFDTLVARYYLGVYSFACRFTDDGRKARALTRDAFDSTRKQMQTRCDEDVLASVLISNVIRAGLALESNLAQTAELKTRNQNFGRRYGAHGKTVTGLFQAGCATRRSRKVVPFAAKYCGTLLGFGVDRGR
jgi:uncharacterized membrane protein (UPF0136 family)